MSLFSPSSLRTAYISSSTVSLQHLSETFLILWRIERDISNMYIGLHVKYHLFLSDFKMTWILSTGLRKILKYQISRKSVQWEPRCSMGTDRQADRHDAANTVVAFCNFAKAPKKDAATRDSPFTLSHFISLRNLFWALCHNNFPESTAKTCLTREFCIV